MNLSRLTGTIGAEVTGIRLADADQALVASIKDLLHKHCVLAVRDQFLGPEQQIRLGKMLGEITYTPNLVHNSAWPEIYRIDNPGKANARTENWHTDAAFSTRPASYSILAAQVLPEAGGDTMFSNQMAAYDRLSEPYKRMLRGMRVEFIGYGQGPGPDWPRAVHPLVRTIPETGRRVLYLALPGQASRIVGMRESESLALLSFLYNQSIHTIDSMYRHRWLPGDVVLWDNRTTLHAAPHDYGELQRTMHRVILTGEEPFESPYPD